MSLFGRRTADVERLRELDRMNREARESLLKEQARGHIIGWLNDFRFLHRQLAKQADGIRDDLYTLIIGDAVQECASFQFTHENQELSLAELLLDLENRLAEYILYLAYRFGYYDRSLAGAITRIAQCGQLSLIIQYCLELEESMNRPLS